MRSSHPMTRQVQLELNAMGSPIFGIAALGNHIELYFCDACINDGCQAWFRQDVMPALAASPRPLVIGMERGVMSEVWASRFRDRGHRVYVVTANREIDEAANRGRISAAKSVCQAAALMHAAPVARC